MRYAQTRRRSCGKRGGGNGVHVRPNPPAAWIVIASAVASALLAKIIVLALAPLATNATWCLPRAAGGTSPPSPAREVCAADAL
jgi:hypothetical protein